jgi:hypothetical protein
MGAELWKALDGSVIDHDDLYYSNACACIHA